MPKKKVVRKPVEKLSYKEEDVENRKELMHPYPF